MKTTIIEPQEQDDTHPLRFDMSQTLACCESPPWHRTGDRRSIMVTIKLI